MSSFELGLKHCWKAFRYQKKGGGQHGRALKALDEVVTHYGGSDTQLLYHYLGMFCFVYTLNTKDSNNGKRVKTFSESLDNKEIRPACIPSGMLIIFFSYCTKLVIILCCPSLRTSTMLKPMMPLKLLG